MASQINKYDDDTSVGERQLQLSEALKRTPSSSFMEALESFVTWMINVEQLLASETFVVGELEQMEHQLSQYLVSQVFVDLVGCLLI